MIEGNCLFASVLACKAGSVVSWLSELGTAGDLRAVAVVSGSPALLGVLAHAAAAFGVALFPIDPALPDALIGELLEQAGCGLVISERVVPGYHCIKPDALPSGEKSSPPKSRLAMNDVALMIATSGSMGRPRVVMLTVNNLRASALAAGTRTPLKPGDTWLACLPLFHIGGYSIPVRCALAGAEAVLLDGFDVRLVADALHTHSITHLSLVPAMLAQLLDTTPAPPPSLRHLLVGGASLPPALAGRALVLGWPIQASYGMSETASQIATTERLSSPYADGLVGEPLPGVEITIDADQRLRVRGPMLMAGYANPKHTRGEGLTDGWLLTGDRARLTDAGELVILGRADHIIISGGKKIAPEAVEQAMLVCPGVSEVGVAGRPDPIWGEVVTAIYSGEIGGQQLLDWCHARLPGNLRPRAARCVAMLPRLSNGKLDRQELRRLAAE